jgi:hypothetical protein
MDALTVAHESKKSCLKAIYFRTHGVTYGNMHRFARTLNRTEQSLLRQCRVPLAGQIRRGHGVTPILRFRTNTHLNQPNRWWGQFFECRMAQVDDAPILYKPVCRPAIGHSHDDTFDLPVCRSAGDQQPRLQRIEPGSGGELIWIKAFAISHQLAAMSLAIP